MFSRIPGSQEDPSFCICGLGRWLPLTDSIVRKHLKQIIRILGWGHKQVTFHAFRRSGASCAFQHGVPIDQDKNQGTWSSVCGNIFTQPVIRFLILSYKPSNYTFPIDGCLTEFILCLLSCVILIYSIISKKIKGNSFPPLVGLVSTE